MALIEQRVTENGIVEYDKVAVAIRTLRDYEEIANKKKDADGKSGYYVCISGGKDSSVIQELCIMAGVNCQFYHNHTTLDHPETVYFVRREKKRLEGIGYEFNITYPKESIESLVKRKRMLPTRLVRYCCAELKESGGRDRVIVTGVRRAESVNRKDEALVVSRGKRKADRVILQNDNNDKRRSVEHCTLLSTIAVNIILDWSDADVWEFIHKYNVPYNPLYDMGYKCVGCVGCPMSTHKAEELDANPKFKQRWMRICQWLAENNTNGKFQTAQEIYDWWTEKTKSTKPDENQFDIDFDMDED